MEQKYIYLKNHNINLFFNIFTSLKNDGAFSYDINFNYFINYINFLNIKEETSFIFSDNDKNVGLFLSSIKGKKAYIPAIIVLKKYRGQGYGKVLLQKGISLLLENNCNIVILEVLKINENAVKLYKDEKFKIKNEILSFRNESNSFYKKYLDNEYKITNPESYSFHILYKTFHKQPQPWQKKLSLLLTKIRLNESSLYLIQDSNELTCGYFVISRKDNILEIDDIGLKEEAYSSFDCLITLLLKGEKIVQANSFYINDPLCEVFERNGFFIDNIQYEMERKLL
jgi:ribosomal protein S18 acetylase RimI-like enzyme